MLLAAVVLAGLDLALLVVLLLLGLHLLNERSDLRNPTVRDIARLGSSLGLRFHFDLIPRKRDEEYEAMLQVVGAARTWRMDPTIQNEAVVNTALEYLDDVQEGDRG